MSTHRRLPSLTSLRAFEAAGRHLSFTKAAEELTVTQAAISHQVKALEDYLNVPLFLRLPRQLQLTKAGKILLPVVRNAFDRIAATVTDLGMPVSGTALKIRLAPSFAAKWLSPRLDDFRRKHPHIELSLTHSNEAADFSRQAIDIAITYGTGDWRGVVSDRVLNIDFFPVCAPQFMQGQHPLSKVENLVHYKLLHDTDNSAWSDWLLLAGVETVDPQRGTVVDDTNVLIQAAIDGLGIALGSSHFVADHLASGRLVRPFDITLHNDYAYYVVCPKTHLKRPVVAVFKSWLMDQAREDD
jgi:LysR family glycine cleavage system transcriptional activator